MFVHVRLHHDNAPIHTSKLSYPQYYPDVANCDLFPVSKIQKVLISRGRPYGHRTQPSVSTPKD